MRFSSTPGIREKEKALRLACMVFGGARMEESGYYHPVQLLTVDVFV